MCSIVLTGALYTALAVSVSLCAALVMVAAGMRRTALRIVERQK